jgi:hypothetical protein
LATLRQKHTITVHYDVLNKLKWDSYAILP